MKVAIIGTREPTEDQLINARTLASTLSVEGYTVATGAAYGVDHAAMQGATGPGVLEVYLPWPSYNKELVPAHAKRIVYDDLKFPSWADSVQKYHPAPSRLTGAARKLMARNYGIVEGCALVIALPQKEGTGGTGQGIRIARALGTPLIQQAANVGLFDSSEEALVNLALDVLRRKAK